MNGGKYRVSVLVSENPAELVQSKSLPGVIRSILTDSRSNLRTACLEKVAKWSNDP